jgi:Mg-chelatase subunit ChlD
MQQDMIDKIGLQAVLSDPDALENIKPDVSLVSALLMLKETIPHETKHTARLLVRHVVRDLMQRLKSPMQQAIRGALNRAQRKRNPKHSEIDWDKTIRANLKHYQTDYKTVIPEQLIGYGRRRQQSKRHIIICIDQSGSMASSMVYASIFGAVMASIPALKTSMVLFDTSVVDITPHLADPVDVLFGTMLGGGTDINRAVGYCQTLIERPEDTTLVLITDLFEGGSRNQLLQRLEHIVQSGAQMITLLALSDSGTPSYDKRLADEFAERGVVSFACTPDLFPELMAATMNKRDISAWAMEHELAHIFDRDDI